LIGVPSHDTAAPVALQPCPLFSVPELGSLLTAMHVTIHQQIHCLHSAHQQDFQFLEQRVICRKNDNHGADLPVPSLALP
jgi:hypothetical protein